jgi:hypothetical protein
MENNEKNIQYGAQANNQGSETNISQHLMRIIRALGRVLMLGASLLATYAITKVILSPNIYILSEVSVVPEAILNNIKKTLVVSNNPEATAQELKAKYVKCNLVVKAITDPAEQIEKLIKTKTKKIVSVIAYEDVDMPNVRKIDTGFNLVLISYKDKRTDINKDSVPQAAVLGTLNKKIGTAEKRLLNATSNNLATEYQKCKVYATNGQLIEAFKNKEINSILLYSTTDNINKVHETFNNITDDSIDFTVLSKVVILVPDNDNSAIDPQIFEDIHETSDALNETVSEMETDINNEFNKELNNINNTENRIMSSMKTIELELEEEVVNNDTNIKMPTVTDTEIQALDERIKALKAKIANTQQDIDRARAMRNELNTQTND